MTTHRSNDFVFQKSLRGWIRDPASKDHLPLTARLTKELLPEYILSSERKERVDCPRQRRRGVLHDADQTW